MIIILISECIKTLLIKEFKISNINHSLEYTICKHVYFEEITNGMGVYATYLYDKIRHKGVNKKTFYYVIKKLEDRGIIIKEKRDGLLFLRGNNFLVETLLNLIKKKRNSNSNDEEIFYRKMVKTRASPHELKELALSQIRGKRLLSIRDRRKLGLCFKEYLSQIEDKKLVFYNIKEDDVLIKDYITRFNSKGKLIELKEKFEEVFNKASDKYEYGVFVTLTVNPKYFRDVYDAAKSMGSGLNRFITYLRKKLKGRFSYICVYEFQKNGLIHLHLVIFGVKWLMPQRELSKLWKKYRMGEIVYLYALKQEGGEWVWLRKKPKDAQKKSVSGYLSKYLGKAIKGVRKVAKKSGEKPGIYGGGGFDYYMDLALYWVTNKRFYTYSRDLKPGDGEERKKLPSGYVFIGVYSKEVLENVLVEDIISKALGIYSRIFNYYQTAIPVGG